LKSGIFGQNSKTRLQEAIPFYQNPGPQTGNKIKIAAEKAPKFTPGKGLKALVG
jgi:hypothetical protein